jgi:renalase
VSESDPGPGPAPVVVVGAGLAGAACALELVSAGVPVRVLDRGRRPGGRMSGRAFDDGGDLGDREVDLGASYFTADDPEFRTVAQDWRVSGLARHWTSTFTVLHGGDPAEDKKGPVRWGGTRGLRALVDDVLEPVTAGGALERRQVESVAVASDGTLTVDGAPAGAVVLAMPDPQAVRLLGDGLGDVAAVLTREWEPTLALAARFEHRTWDHVSPSGTFHGAFVNDDPVLSWIADDGRRRGDDAPVVVAHSTPELAARYLDDPAAAAPVMAMALSSLLDAGDPAETRVQRWTFAKPTGERPEPFHLSAVGSGLVGVCGDGWGETSKVETAYVSGAALGRALAARLA